MHRQCVYECAALWDHFGPQLETDYPEPYEILNLVVIAAGAGMGVDSGLPDFRINPRACQVPCSRDIGIATGSLAALQGIDAALQGLLEPDGQAPGLICGVNFAP